MGNLLLDLLPLAFGAMLVPIFVILALMLLTSERGLSKAAAFLAGILVMRLLQWVVFGLVFVPATEAETSAGLRLLGPMLMTVLGVMLLASGIRKWRKEPDSDDQPPAWMNKFNTLSVFQALAGGALLMLISVKQWVFTLSAITIILEARLVPPGGLVAYLSFTLIAMALMLLPILAYAVAPQHSAEPLRNAQAWLERNNRSVAIVVSLVFGTWFLIRGITGLTV
jgi:hypothetical protein